MKDVFNQLINAKNNRNKKIPIEWAEQIRDYMQNEIIEHENAYRLLNKQNNIIKNIMFEIYGDCPSDISNIDKETIKTTLLLIKKAMKIDKMWDELKSKINNYLKYIEPNHSGLNIVQNINNDIYNIEKNMGYHNND